MNDPEKGYKGPRKEGLDFFVEHVVWKQLPKELFEAFGGRAAAKIRRQEILVSQGKGKVVPIEKEIPESSTILAKEENDVNADTTVTKVDEITTSDDAVKIEEMSMVIDDEENMKKEFKSSRKRTLSFSQIEVKVDSKVTEEESEAISKAQLELEAALEEAEFQSLLLAQNESKILEEDAEKGLIDSQVEVKLFHLMPPVTSLWEEKSRKVAYRVPAVTWTMLDSK